MAVALQKSDLLAHDLLIELGPQDARERDEAWRYSKTALRALSQNKFVVADGNAAVSSALRERFAWPQTQGRRVVFVNGVFSAAHSDFDAKNAAVEIRHATHGRSILAISAGAAEPLHVIYLSIAGTTPSRWSATLDVDVSGGKIHLIEQHLGDDGADVLGALTSAVRVGAGAELGHTLIGEAQDSASLYRRTQTRIESGATLRTTHALLGGRLQRHDVGVDLVGRHARYESRGVFALGGRQHVDTHLEVRHDARDTACDIVWRGVADERARGIFYGAITVAEGADGADAQLSNKNLLLSPLAEIDTQPALEIYADEVKAAHGATVGQLDERALFYLRSRGIPLAEARRMLVGAFSTVALERIDEHWLRDRLATLLAPRVGGADA